MATPPNAAVMFDNPLPRAAPVVLPPKPSHLKGTMIYFSERPSMCPSRVQSDTWRRALGDVGECNVTEKPGPFGGFGPRSPPRCLAGGAARTGAPAPLGTADAGSSIHDGSRGHSGAPAEAAAAEGLPLASVPMVRTLCPWLVVSFGVCVPVTHTPDGLSWDLCPSQPHNAPRQSSCTCGDSVLCAPPPQHDCVYNRMVEGKPPCSPTDDRCCQCGVYVCSECTTGLYPAHSASQGAHCCKVSVASWVETLHVRCGTCSWVHLRVTVQGGGCCVARLR
jgi:hypothetical protein